MPTPSMRNNLGDWQNEPVIQDQVISYMDAIGAPMLLREIYVPLGLPRFTVNRVLGRLHAKGFLSRHRIPAPCHRVDAKTRTIQPGGAIRQCYLYAITEDHSA